MKLVRLTPEETAANGYTHKFVLTYADLTETANNTAQSVTLCALDFGDIVSQRVLVQIVTALAGTITTVTVDVGVTSALTQFISGQNLLTTGTGVAAYTCYAPANTVTDYATPSGGKTLYATFHPDSGHALSAVTAGEIHVFAGISAVGDRQRK